MLDIKIIKCTVICLTLSLEPVGGSKE